MPLSVFTQTMPLDFADAISELEAAPLVDARVLLLLGEVEAGSLEDDPIELAGAELDGVATGVELGAGDSVMAPESIAAFLLLRVRLLEAAVVSLLDSVATGSVPAVSDAFFFLVFFFDPVSLAVVEVSEEAAALSADAVFFRFLDFFVAVVVSSVPAAVSEEAAA